MKQIFDWMRGAILDKAYKVYDGTVGVDIHDVGNIITEAEAKWKADFCQYKPRKAYKVGYCYTTMCCKERTHTLGRESKYCEYCGKPIKISEVE